MCVLFVINDFKLLKKLFFFYIGVEVINNFVLASGV